MSAPCARPGCHHEKRRHNPVSENYDAEKPCDDCDCPDFMDEPPPRGVIQSGGGDGS